MFVRSIRPSTTFAVSLGAAALLAACGGDSGGAGGQGTTTPTTTDTTSTPSTPSDTTTPTTTDSTSTPSTPSDTTSTPTPSGPGCAELCATLSACPDVSPSDCATECPPIETFNQTAGCAEEYEAEVECIIYNATPCEAAYAECSELVSAYGACRSDYCAENSASPGCT